MPALWSCSLKCWKSLTSWRWRCISRPIKLCFHAKFHQSFTDAYQVIENNLYWSLMGSFRCRFILQVSQLRLDMACAMMALGSNQAPLQTFFWLRRRSCGKGKLYVINKSNSWEGKSIHSHFNGSLPGRVPEIIRKHLPLILSIHPFEAFVILQQVSPWELNKMTATRQCQLFDWSIWYDLRLDSAMQRLNQ